MHVLHYSPNFFDMIGGREIFVRGLVDHLQRYNINQSIITNSADRRVHVTQSNSNITVISLPAIKIGAYQILKDLGSNLQNTQYDIINIHGYGEYVADFACLLKLQRKLKIPLVLTTHGIAGLRHGLIALKFSSPFTLTQRMIRMPHLLYDFTMGRLEMSTFDKIIILSEEEKRGLLKLGLKENKMLKIPIAINEFFFNSSTPLDRNCILYVGRIDPYKGLDVLVRALKELHSQYTMDTKCIIIGKDFNYKYQLENLIDQLNLRDSIRIEEHVEQSNLLKFYSSALVTVLPSISEGFPLVPVESMATGTPFIATPVGAIPELIEYGAAGMIVPIGDYKALAQAIARLLKDKSLWSSMSANAKTFSKNFSWDRITEKYYQTYLELLPSYCKI